MDGYQFDAAYQKALTRRGPQVCWCLDDNGDAGYYWADLVLNQNIHAQADWYADRAPHTRLLLGTRYALLRREFLGLARLATRDAPESAYKMLVTLGGSDPDNVTLKVLEALSLVPAERLEATVVIGGGNPHRASLEAAAKRRGLSDPSGRQRAQHAGTDGLGRHGRLAPGAALLGTGVHRRPRPARGNGGKPAGHRAWFGRSRGRAKDLGWAGEPDSDGAGRGSDAMAGRQDAREEMSRRARATGGRAGSERVLEALHL